MQGVPGIEVRNSPVLLKNCLMTDHGRTGITVYGESTRLSVLSCTIGSISSLEEPYVSYPIYFWEGAEMSASLVANSILGFGSKSNIRPMAVSKDALPFVSSTIKLEYNLLVGAEKDGGSTLEIGNIEGVDPLFVDPANGDFRLQPFSPGIDAADPSASFSDEPGTNGCRANVGYYGNTAEATESSIEITAPNGGEVFTAGSPLTITWNSSRYSGPKLLEYSTSSGSAWSRIDTIEVDSGSYIWAIPEALAGTQARVRISYLNCRSVTDQSDAAFAIHSTSVLPRQLGNIIDPQNQFKTITVYDPAGRLVVNRTNVASVGNFKGQIGHLSPGIYTVEFSSSRGKHRQSILIGR
jgi:hypothetical protein